MGLTWLTLCQWGLALNERCSSISTSHIVRLVPDTCFHEPMGSVLSRLHPLWLDSILLQSDFVKSLALERSLLLH